MSFLLLILLSLNPAKDFKYAKGLFEDGLYDLAETELIDFLNNYPNSIYAPEASVLLVRSLNGQGSFEKTIVKCKEFLFKYPSKKEEFLIEWGQAEIKLTNYDSAIEVINRLTDKDKKELYLGEAYYAKGDFKEALNHYSKSNIPYSNLGMGWTYLALKDYKKAASVFSKLRGQYAEEGAFLYAQSLFLSNNKDSENAFLSYLKDFSEGKYAGRAYSHLADIKENESKPEDAIQYLKKIPLADPSLSGFSSYRIGLIEYEKGKYEDAIEYFDSVGGNDAYFWDAQYWKALTLSKEGKENEALAYLIAVSKNDFDLRNESLYEIGLIYKNQGDYDKAKENLEKIEGELWDEANIEIGNILLKEGNDNEAYSKFMEVVEKDKGSVNLALFQAAVTKKKQSEFNNSLGLLETYEKKFPRGEEIDKVHLLKGDIYQSLKEYRKAIEEYNNINIERSPELNPYVLETKGWALMGLKRYDMAFNNLEELSEKFPDFCSRAEIYFQLGNAAYAMGDSKSAERAFRQVQGERKPEALFNIGKMFLENKEYDKAIEEFMNIKRNFSVSNYSEISSYYIALALRKSNDLRASNEHLYSMISETGDAEILVESFLLLGDNYFDQAKFDSSFKYYTRGFETVREKLSGPTFSSLALTSVRGILLSVNSSSGSSQMEKEAKDLIRKLKGSNLEDKINLITGNILFNSGEYNRAINYLEYSSEPDSYYQIGLAFLKLGRKDQAIQFLSKAAKTNEFKDKAFLELGRIEFNSENIKGAKDYLVKSSLPEASLLFASCLQKEGKEKEAVENLLKLRGKVDGLAYIELAKIQIKNKDFNSALKNLEEATAFERSEAEAYYLMGQILLDTGKEEDALKILLKVKYLHPESEWVSASLYLLAEITLKRGEKERAINYLKEIIERGEEPWLGKAKNKISELNK
jgi:tetratricopeptide (TPR) repeat protein